MKRREFITLVGGAAAAWPLAARAQQTDRMRRIGVLQGGSDRDDQRSQPSMAAFLQGLQQSGWTDGRNVRIDYRWPAGDADKARKYAAELVALAPDVILTASSISLAALLQTTRTVPIVFVGVADPVGTGFVKSLSRPGGNATGFMLFDYDLSAKWLELLKEIAPGVRRAAVLRDSCDSLRHRPVRRHPIRVAASRRRGEPRRNARRARDRARRRGLRAPRERRPDRAPEPSHRRQSPADHRDGGPAPLACGLRLPPLRRGRRPHLLRDRCGRPVPARGVLRRSHPARREARRPAGAGADEVRACDQSEDREGARPRGALDSTAARRRGDRVINRREFISLLGGAAAAWPLAGRAQQGAMPVVGLLTSRAADLRVREFSTARLR